MVRWRCDTLMSRFAPAFWMFTEWSLRRPKMSYWPMLRRHLPAVIVLDQFSRNMFRSTPRAFANDA